MYNFNKKLHYTMKLLPTSILLISLVFTVEAQNRIFNPVEPPIRFAFGQVITLDGDTLLGDIQIRNKGLVNYNNRILFRDGKGEETFYMAEEIAGFVLKRDNMAQVFGSATLESTDQEFVYFDTRPQPDGRKAGRPIFMQRLYYSPRISLYYNQTSGATTTTSVDDIAVAEKELRYWVAKDDQPLFKLLKRQYEENLPGLFYDCEEVKAKLEATQQLRRFNQFEEVLELYRRCE
jgi:hypothetical protein